MTSAQDHKSRSGRQIRIEYGRNGNFLPSPFYEEVDEFCRKYVYQPTVDAMLQKDAHLRESFSLGLMLTPDGPKVLEYNARLAIRAQVVLPRMKNDIIE